MKFESKHKGIPYNSVEAIMRREVETWFAKRDKNVTVNYSKSIIGTSGEILSTYLGTIKDTHFNIQVTGLFISWLV